MKNIRAIKISGYFCAVLLMSATANSQNTATAPKVTVPTVMPPKVTPPTVTPPTAPVGTETEDDDASDTAAVAPKPSGPAGPASTTVVAAAFNEASFKATVASDSVAIIVFSKASDAVWDLQAPALRAVLKEPEFAKIPTFQIDLASKALAEKFLVNTAATIIVYKGGVERMRSQRMTKPDVIRKMLRLSTAL